MLQIGILQGRLSNSIDGRFQFFPRDWQAEFRLASELGFASIEWLVDWPDWETNPILLPSRHRDVQTVARESGITVNSICADYFMKFRLTGSEAEKSSAMAVKLVRMASQLTTQKLVLVPCLENNAYSTEEERLEVVENLMPAVQEAEKLGARIGLESEMPAYEIVSFIKRFRSPAIGVYYDIGNCTSYGFDCPAELRTLGDRVFGVHVKDRKVRSPESLLLGSGDADIEGCFEALQEIGFKGVPIMQAWRGINYLQDARTQLSFLQSMEA